MVLLDSVGFRGDLWKPVGFTGQTNSRVIMDQTGVNLCQWPFVNVSGDH